jgi:hypothetical protein
MMAQRNWWTDWDLSYTDNIFGPLIGGNSVQEAFYKTLQEWLPTYIAEINRKLGSQVLLEPFEYRHRPEFRNLPRNASAAILIEVPNTIGVPRIYQNAIRVNWRVEVLIYVYGTKDWQETQALTSAYAAAVRAAIIQHRGLGGFAQTTIWEGEEYAEGEHSGGRTTGIAHLRFAVTVGNAMTMFGGPPSPQYAPTGASTGPSILPPEPAFQVEDVNVEVIKEDI